MHMVQLIHVSVFKYSYMNNNFIKNFKPLIHLNNCTENISNYS